MSERLQEVMLLRLITGEDIIAFIEDNADETFTVISPMLIEIQEHRATKQELMFLRHWLPTQLVEENSAIINKTKILTAILPSEKFYEHYVNIVDELHEQKEATKENFKANLYKQ